MKQVLELLIIIIIIFIQVIDDGSERKYDNIEKQTISKVVRIVDGDTFDIASGQRVRMIGIDTPERGEYFYKEASAKLKNLIGGMDVVLIKDVSETDRYGRLLRHVYLDGVWINKQMVDEGFAKLLTIPPDVEHVQVFEQAQRKARNAKRGIWADSYYK